MAPLVSPHSQRCRPAIDLGDCIELSHLRMETWSRRTTFTSHRDGTIITLTCLHPTLYNNCFPTWNPVSDNRTIQAVIRTSNTCLRVGQLRARRQLPRPAFEVDVSGRAVALSDRSSYVLRQVFWWRIDHFVFSCLSTAASELSARCAESVRFGVEWLTRLGAFDNWTAQDRSVDPERLPTKQERPPPPRFQQMTDIHHVLTTLV